MAEVEHDHRGHRGPDGNCTVCHPVIQHKPRITQAVLDAQRAAGWPDFHPEDFCHRCGGPNFSWCVDSDIWDPIMRPFGPGSEWKWHEIVCPVCFVELAQEHCKRGLIWELRLGPEDHAGGRELEAISEQYRERFGSLEERYR